MIVDAVRNVPSDEQFDVSSFGVMCLLGIATSIDAFVVGIGLGLDVGLPQIVLAVVVVGIMTFLVSLFGVFLGKRKVAIPERLAGIIAGVVLVGLGIITLVEHLSVEG